jgi:hypothetical protein
MVRVQRASVSDAARSFRTDGLNRDIWL